MKTFFSRRSFDVVFFGFLFLTGIALTMYLNNLPPQPKQKIRSDKAGYYIYLPATFIYHWEARQMPPGIGKDCEGFFPDSASNKIHTKYTCGVALLYTPFWLAIHGTALAMNIRADGFTPFYQWMMLIPSVFYMILGLWFLFRFLRFYFSKGLSLVTVLLIYAGTNLFYYGMIEGLMAHTSSFFLFSLYLFLLKKYLTSDRRSLPLFAGMEMVVAMIILVRPTGIVIATSFFFLDTGSFHEIGQRVRIFFKPIHLFLMAVISLFVFLPQLLYWKYLTGSYISYSYHDESFSLLTHPQIIPAWFSPLNGFFLYTPLAVTFIAGMLLMIRKRLPSGIFIALLFFFASYLFSSWASWYFGGAFGWRPMVEFYAILAVPFAVFIGWLHTLRNMYLRSLFILFIAGTAWYNLRFTFSPHWYSSSTWEWDDYLKQIDKAGLYSFPNTSFCFKEDFENNSFTKFYRETECYHSPTVAGMTDTAGEYYTILQRQINGIMMNPVRLVHASIWVKPGVTAKTGLLLYFTLKDWQNNVYFYRHFEVDHFLRMPGEWAKISGTVWIPEWADQGGILAIGLRNHDKHAGICFDDLELRFE